MKKSTLIIILIFITLILGTAFYWYEWRPAHIIKICDQEAKEGAIRIMRGKNMELAENGQYYRLDYENEYEKCLKKNGIEK